jgi:hypothetical protein
MLPGFCGTTKFPISEQKSDKFTQRLHERGYYKSEGIFESYSVAYFYAKI